MIPLPLLVSDRRPWSLLDPEEALDTDGSVVDVASDCEIASPLVRGDKDAGV